MTTRGGPWAAPASEAPQASTSPNIWGVLDALPLGVVVSDGGGRISHINPPAQRLRDGGVRTALAWQAVLDISSQARDDGRSRRREVDLLGPPPESLVVEASVPAGQNDVVAVIRDVTEMRQLEAVRRDFVANVSHELRTPIGAISVLADALAGSPAADDTERLARRVRAEADRLTDLVTDLLDLSRIEAVRPDPQGPPIDLTSVVSAAVDRCRPTCEGRETPLRVSTDVDSALVCGDEAQLVSAVANLIENAAKYSEPGTPVELEITSAGPEWIAVVVRDQGVGVPSWELERIFERFYRVDRARDRGSGGTGLGLAIVRNVAANHGGTVTVESREGEGSAFTLKLPRADVGS